MLARRKLVEVVGEDLQQAFAVSVRVGIDNHIEALVDDFHFDNVSGDERVAVAVHRAVALACDAYFFAAESPNI